VDETGLDATSAGDGALPQVPEVDPFVDTGPIPAVIGPFPADHHTHAAHSHPHVAPPAPHVPVAPPRHAAPRRYGRGAIIAAAVVALLGVGAAAAVAMTRNGTDPAASPAAASSTGATVGAGPGGSTSGSATPTASAVPMLPASQSTLVLGDSLALTVYPWLADLLPDRYVSYEAEVGASTAKAERALADLATVPPVVIISAGTNDSFATDVEASARRILDRLGTGRCVVWVDVVRPERVGDPQADLNAAIDRAVLGRPNVTVLRWTEAVIAHPEWLSGDGIHPTEAGAQARAEAFAAASTSCSPLDPAAPRAKRQFLPSSAFTGPLQGQGSLSGSGSSKSATPGSTSSAGSTSSRSPSASRSASASTAPAPAPSTPAPSLPAPPSPTPQPTSAPADPSTPASSST
jgi:hypothetical protein